MSVVVGIYDGFGHPPKDDKAIIESLRARIAYLEQQLAAANVIIGGTSTSVPQN